MGSLNDPKTAVTLIGAGTQGRRLAFMWTSAGRDVYLVDQQEKQLQDALTFVDKLRGQPEFSNGKKFGTVTINQPQDLKRVLADSWLVLESVPERVPLKQKVLAELDELAPSDTIIASNSSSYTIAEIISGMTLKHPERILSAHSYWPPETTAIEIMGHETTDPSHIERMMNECQVHHFSPYHVKRSSVGYIYNRIWAAIKREALLVAAEDIATPAEIDKLFKDVLKARMGPFEQMDIVGLDVVHDIEEHYAATRTGIPTEPRQYLRRYLDEGKLGVKTGKGFFEYDGK